MGEIGYLQNYKQQKKSLIIGVCGCMAQEEVVVEKIIKSYPSVQLIFGTHNLYEIPQMIENIISNNRKSVSVYSVQGNIYEGLPSRRSLKHKASVSIMDGCDKFCTYCIVPYTRGQQRSRLMEDVLKECEQLRENGYKEVTLLGQNVNAYGKDLKLGYDFADLLNRTADLGIERIRFTTSHPWDFTDGMIEAIAHRENIMPYIHLPLQSGSNEILRRMGRRYKREDYLDLFDRIRKNVRDVAVSTDIIVGFPNETEEQFAQTMEVVDYCKYDNAFTFIYSPRELTPAAVMKDNVTLEEKKSRLYCLNEKLAVYSKAHNVEYVGKTVKVLVDGFSKTDITVMSGYTPQNKLVNFRSNSARVGDIIDVVITEGMKNSLNGVDASIKENKNE